MVAIQQETTVQPGGVIHIHSSQLPPGARARVTVVIAQEPAMILPSMGSLLTAAEPPFASPDEIDASLRAERDSWER